jgi:hypothetical protein
LLIEVAANNTGGTVGKTKTKQKEKGKQKPTKGSGGKEGH